MTGFSDEEFYRDVRLPVERATTMNPLAYRSPEFFDAEQEKVFAGAWVCVGYTSQVPAGLSVPVDVAGQSVLLCRDPVGQIRAFYNVCRHRGSALVTEPTRQDKIRCPYHGWAYSTTGELTGCPLFKGATLASEFRKEDYGLLPVRVETWGCFIFVNLDGRAMPLSRHLGDFTEQYGSFPLDELVLVRRKHFSIKANWKIVAENFLEYYHLPWVHPELCTVTAVERHKRNQGAGMYMSFLASPLLKGGTPLDADYLPPMPRLGPEQAETGYFPLVFPNLAMFLMPHHLLSLILQPAEAGRCDEYADLLVHPTLLEEPGVQAKIDEVFAFYDMVNVQDIEAVERVQVGIQQSAYTGGRMTHRFEEPLHRFQNIIADHMTGHPVVRPGDGRVIPSNPQDSRWQETPSAPRSRGSEEAEL